MKRILLICLCFLMLSACLFAQDIPRPKLNPLKIDKGGTSATTAAAALTALGAGAATDIPNNASFTLAGLGTKAFSNLTGIPTTLAGYGIIDSPNNASFTLAGLGTKAFANLTSIPTTITGYGITDCASTAALPNNASFTHDALSTVSGSTGHDTRYFPLAGSYTQSVSVQDLKFNNDAFRISKEGGLLALMYNVSSVNATCGALVIASSTEESFVLIPANASFPTGIVYDAAGIASTARGWVTIAGRVATVTLDAAGASAGWVITPSVTVDGQSAAAAGTHAAAFGRAMKNTTATTTSVYFR